ncbi:MAG: GNAT family N-acetyltransferase [Myxococcota bacterium]
MEAAELKVGHDVDPGPLYALYEAVGWTAYTRDPARLREAVRNSTWVATLWQEGTLVGLVRVVSDDVSIAWLQDILVHPDHQRAGLGRRLAHAALERFAHVRSFALMTDDEPRQHAFYASLGLQETRAAHGGRLHTFVRMTKGRP